MTPKTEQDKKIVELYRNKVSQSDIARALDLHRQYVFRRLRYFRITRRKNK